VRGTLRSSLVTPAGMPLPRILGDQLARQEATIARPGARQSRRDKAEGAGGGGSSPESA